MPAVGLEDGLLQALEPAVVADVHVGVVDEDTGLHVATGVDVAVDAASRDAAAHILAVVLEVHGEDGLAALDAADLADAVQHVLALLDGGHEVGVGALPHRHVVEEPGPAAALLDDEVEELVARDALRVLARVGGGGAVEQTVRLHEVEGAHDLLERTVTTAAVIHAGLVALERDREHDVAQALHVLAEPLVHQ